MKSSTSITLGGKRFSSQKSCREFLWNVIKTKPGKIVDAQLHAIVHDLFKRHVNYANKVGAGVDYYYVGQSSFSEKDCFHVMRVDGSFTDFGIEKCLTNVLKVNKESFRKIIKYQIDAYKSRFNGGKTFRSEYSGDIFPYFQMHVDHVIPFDVIVRRFCELSGLDLSSEVLAKSADNNLTCELVDAGMTEQWRRFHKLFPIRVVSSFENLSTLKKQQKKISEEKFIKQIDEIIKENDFTFLKKVTI